MGVPYRILEDGEPQELEPALSPTLRHGILLPLNRAVAHPQVYVARIAEAFIREGGRHLKPRLAGYVARASG